MLPVFFSNRHVIVALIVAPVLALLSYFLIGFFVAEQPHKALDGQSYQLLAKSNCRYPSGQCDLVNGSFKSTLVIEQNKVLRLRSSHPLKQVKIGFVVAGNTLETTQPQTMQGQDNTQKIWTIDLPQPPDKQLSVRLAMLSGGSYYYVETTLGFSTAE